MNTQLITETVLAVMLQLAPPERARAAAPGFEETVEERTARYGEIARDIVEVVVDKGRVPGFSSVETIALVVAVAHHESGFAADIDAGECFRGVDPKRCDSGRAICILQVHAFAGATANELKDRRTCIASAVYKLRASANMCRTNAPADRFAAYGSGSCDAGREGSAALFGMWRRVNGLAKYEASRRERARRRASSTATRAG